MKRLIMFILVLLPFLLPAQEAIEIFGGRFTTTASTSLGGSSIQVSGVFKHSRNTWKADSIQVGDWLIDCDCNSFVVASITSTLDNSIIMTVTAQNAGVTKVKACTGGIIRPFDDYIRFPNDLPTPIIDCILNYNYNVVPAPFESIYVSNDTMYFINTEGDTVSVFNEINISNLSDVDTTGIEAGDILQWNGTTWIVVNAPTYISSDSMATQLVYAPAHGLTDSIAYYGYIPVKSDFTRANATSVDSAFIAYAIDAPHVDSLLLMFSGFLNYVVWHGKEINVQYYLQDDGTEDTTPGTVSIPTAIASDSLTLLLREVGSDIAGRLRRVAVPSPMITAFGGDPRIPTDSVMQAAIEGVYLPAGIAQPGTIFTLSYSGQTDNPTYIETSPNSNPLTPSHAWLWDGAYATRITTIATSVDLQDSLFGGLGIVPLIPIDDIAVSLPPTDEEVAVWLDTNYTVNNVRLTNGTNLYYIGAGTRQSPDYIWQVVDDVSWSGADTQWERIIKRIQSPGVATDTSGYNRNFYVATDSLYIGDDNDTLSVALSLIDVDLAANGLTMSGDSVILGGTLNKTTSLATLGYQLGLSGARTTNNPVFSVTNTGSGEAVYASSSTGIAVNSIGVYGVKGNGSGYGLWGVSSGGTAGYFTSTSGYGIVASSSSGPGVDIQTTTGLPLGVSQQPATTNTVATLVYLNRNTSGTGAPGIGGSIKYFNMLRTLGRESASLEAVITDSTYATYSSRFGIHTAYNGTVSRKFNIAGTGQLTLDGYAANALNNPDSVLYVTGVDATGDMYTISVDSLAGGGTVNNNYYSITKSQADSLVTGSLVQPGAVYRISDCSPDHYGGTDLFLMGTTVDAFSQDGAGVFYTPKYDQAKTGFGIWQEDSTYIAGDTVFWGGYAWINQTGDVGSADDILNLGATDWTAIPFDSITYNVWLDEVSYDYANDWISRRYNAQAGIEVSMPYGLDFLWNGAEGWFPSISVMQWGNGSTGNLVGVFSQKITDSYNENINFRGSYQFNLIFDNGSYQSYFTFNNGSGQSNLTFDNGSYQSNLTFDNESYQTQLTFDNGSYQSYFTFNNGSGQSDLTFDNGSGQTYFTFNNGAGQFNLTFDNSAGQSNLTATTDGMQSTLHYISYQSDRTGDTLAVTEEGIYINANATVQYPNITEDNAPEYVAVFDADLGLHYIAPDSLAGGGAADGNGMFDAANEGDTIRVSEALVESTTFRIQHEGYFRIRSNGGNASFSAEMGGYDNQIAGFSALVDSTVSAESSMSAYGKNNGNFSAIRVDTISTRINGNGVSAYSYHFPIHQPAVSPGDTSVMVFLHDSTSVFIDKALFGGGADTDDQTLSTSRDTVTISDGNSVRTPGNGFLRDSVTGATLTVDLKYYNNAVVVLKMESATSVTLTINNPWGNTAVDATYPTFEGQTGVYTFHFLGTSGTDNVTWPATFLDMGGTALGTDAITAGTCYTCYYDPVGAKYYCK